MSLADLSKMLTEDGPVNFPLVTAPIPLSEVHGGITLDVKEPYHISVDDGDNLIVRMGFGVTKAAARFQHPNIAARRQTIHEFKHYYASGHKRWTSKAGVDIYFIIPRDKVMLLPIKGNSYIKATINGVPVSFNVSGGTLNGWTDWLHKTTETSVNHKLSDVKKIAECALPGSIDIPVKEDDARDQERWQHLAAKADTELKEVIYKMIEDKKNPIIVLDGCTEKEGTGVELYRGSKKTNIEKDEQGNIKSWTWAYEGKVKGILMHCGYLVRAKLSQIDWYQTFIRNGLRDGKAA